MRFLSCDGSLQPSQILVLPLQLVDDGALPSDDFRLAPQPFAAAPCAKRSGSAELVAARLVVLLQTSERRVQLVVEAAAVLQGQHRQGMP